jgi:hypothetical protein
MPNTLLSKVWALRTQRGAAAVMNPRAFRLQQARLGR